MIVKIGKRKLKQTNDGNTPDDIRWIDTESGEEFDFDDYITLIKEQ